MIGFVSRSESIGRVMKMTNNAVELCCKIQQDKEYIFTEAELVEVSDVVKQLTAIVNNMTQARYDRRKE